MFVWVLRPALLPCSSHSSSLQARACHTFLFGALNYTVERRRTEVQQLQKHNQYALILKGDQLKQQQMGGLLPGFCEHPIAFDPTEKSDPCLSPSYTDRILWRSLSSDRVQCITYSSVPQADIEDRAPIYATFRLKVAACCAPLGQALVSGLVELPGEGGGNSCPFLFQSVFYMSHFTTAALSKLINSAVRCNPFAL